MARIRTIKPEFWTNEQITECSLNARLLFIGLWNFCDDAGRMPLKLDQIKMKIFPGDDIDSATVQGMLGELSVNGLIETYFVADQEYLQVTGWHHQKINRPQKPRFPGPSEGDSLNTHGALTVGCEESTPPTHESSDDAAALAEAEPDRAHVVGNFGRQSPWHQAAMRAIEADDLDTAKSITAVAQNDLDEANRLGEEYLGR